MTSAFNVANQLTITIPAGTGTRHAHGSAGYQRADPPPRGREDHLPQRRRRSPTLSTATAASRTRTPPPASGHRLHGHADGGRDLVLPQPRGWRDGPPGSRHAVTLPLTPRMIDLRSAPADGGRSRFGGNSASEPGIFSDCLRVKAPPGGEVPSVGENAPQERVSSYILRNRRTLLLAVFISALLPACIDGELTGGR